MSIMIKKPGILTTVQDLGRVGYRRYGINPGGAMDVAAARLANVVVGNDENEAVTEMHFPAPEIVFEANAIAAICGADLSPVLDGKPIENWRPLFVNKGSTLNFNGRMSGNRAYLAVRGGFKIKEWLGSSSTNLTAAAGGVNGRKLAVSDRIGFKAKAKRQTDKLGGAISMTLRPHYRPFPTVRIVAGAEYEHLTKKGHELLVDHDFTVSANSNRMGFRLIGEPITFAKPREFISSAVSFGTIQTLPDGQLIVLMADHQTAGGYPRVAHIISRDLPLVAQLGANDKVAFHLIDLAGAEQLKVEYEHELNLLRLGCRFQASAWD
jgi:antagonist of KipI